MPAPGLRDVLGAEVGGQPILRGEPVVLGDVLFLRGLGGQQVDAPRLIGGAASIVANAAKRTLMLIGVLVGQAVAAMTRTWRS